MKLPKNTILLILSVQFLLIFILSATTTSLPSDMLENLLWGKDLAFAYDKHPPFFAWESYLTIKLFGGNLLFYHILTPLNQIALLWFIYLLGTKLFKPEKALLAVVLVQGIIFHVFYYKFNGNTANLGFFGAIYFVFYKIIKEEDYKLFPVLGALCGIIMLTKYSAILLIGILGAIGIFTKEGRKAMKSFYLIPAILIFFAIISPNLYEVFVLKNDGAIQYLMNQSLESNRSWYEEIKFLFKLLAFLLPMILAFIVIKKGVRKKFQKNFLKKLKGDLDLKILLSFSLAPFVIVLFYIIIFKATVGAFWLSMFCGPIALLLLYLFEVKKNALQMAIKIIYSINFFLFLIYFIAALGNPEDDTKGIGNFAKEVSEIHSKEAIIKDFICNDDRRFCATAVIYGTDYSKIQMRINRWENPFEAFNKREEKPEMVIIIGEDDKIDLPDYTLTKYKKTFPKYHKIKFFEKFFINPPKLLEREFRKMRKPIEITLTVGIKKDE
jgi:4-amino-4-deoxy-L-arabinose transferase-like glycosyltransferase